MRGAVWGGGKERVCALFDLLCPLFATILATFGTLMTLEEIILA